MDPDVTRTHPELRAVLPNAFYLPSPVVLMGTRSGDGTPDLSTMSAVGVLCLQPPIIGIGIKRSRETYNNVVTTKEFTLNLPLISHLTAIDFLGTRKMRRVPEKIDKSGLELVDMAEVDAPGVAGFPILMGCRLLSVLDRHSLPNERPISHHMVIGQMVECQVQADWIREGEVRIEEIPTVVYLNRYYAGIGELLGVQRFTDDPVVRDRKMRAYRRVH